MKLEYSYLIETILLVLLFASFIPSAQGIDSIDNFTLSMNYSIESNSDDLIVRDNVQNPSEGIVSSDSLDFGYISSEYNNALAGIISSGDYDELKFENHTENYTFSITQSSEGSKVFIPYTKGSYDDIESRENVIKSRTLLNNIKPAISFPLHDEEVVRIILSYNNIKLECFDGPIPAGYHSLYFRNKGIENEKTVIEVQK